MYQPFPSLSGEAHLWVYQAQRELSNQEQATILSTIVHFAASWVSHGRPLVAGAEIRYGYLLLVGIEKPDFELSCCTTDRFMQLLGHIKMTQGIDFLDRQQVLVQTGETFKLMQLAAVREKWTAGLLGESSYIFDNTINKKSELETQWRIPIQQFLA